MRDAVQSDAHASGWDVDVAPVGVDAVTTDGGIIHIRSVAPADADALRDLHLGVSDYSLYMRFFELSRSAAVKYVAQLVAPQNEGHQVLAAWLGDRLVAVAAYEQTGRDAAEVALLVADDLHSKGVGTLLLEHLAARARANGINRFVADILSENHLALRTLREMGCPTTTRFDGGTTLVEMDLRANTKAIGTVGDRERAADAASLRHIFAPASIAVVGASDRPVSVGHQVLRNIVNGGFTGQVHPVNPHHDSVLGLPCVPTPGQLPTGIDLAVIAVPAAAVPAVLQGCGERNVHAAVILTAGFAEAGRSGVELQTRIVRMARHYGMRIVGPNCLGVLNTDPTVRLNATFAPLAMGAGGLALASQSGALGIAVLAAANRDGLGVSQFISIGNKADVSSNDVLLAWEGDNRSQVIALYLESLGNPRKFARIARRVTANKPVIVIKSGRSASGQRAGLSHTAAAVTSESVIDALFHQAGVMRVGTMQEMIDLARLLCEQPLPSGPRVVVIGNSGGPEILAADAADAAELVVEPLSAPTQQLLREAVPAAAATQNPVDLGAVVTPTQMAAALKVLLEAPEVDTVLAVVTDVAVTDPVAMMSHIAETSAFAGKTVIAVRVGGEPCSLPLRQTDGSSLPVFGFPEPAAAALGLATRYSRNRLLTEEPTVRPAAVDVAEAKTVVASSLGTGDRWLDAGDVHRLLTDYGLPVCPQRVVTEPDEAVTAAEQLGYPLAVKIADGGIHKTAAGAVRLGVRDQNELRAAVGAVTAGRPRGTSVLLQPMSPPGLEIIVGGVQHEQFGPVVMVGAGGVYADILADNVFRLAPLSGGDARRMLAELRAQRLLDGYLGAEPVDRERLSDLLVRVGALLDDLPEVAELDINPVICRGESLTIVDARARLAPAGVRVDEMVRQLPL